MKPRPVARVEERPEEKAIGYSWVPSECATLAEWEAHYQSWPEALERLVPGFYTAVMDECLRIGLSDIPKNHKRCKRGQRGITSYGRKMVRNGAYLLKERLPNRKIAFLTLTLPALPLTEEKAVAENWNEILRRFLQWLHRRLAGAGYCPWVVGCTEIQEKRQSRTGGLPLHLHCAFQARGKGGYLFTPREIRDKWAEVVTEVAGIESNPSWESCENLVTVKKDVEGYLGKYLSKGVSVGGSALEASGYKIPSAWWFAVGGLKAAIKARTVSRQGEVAYLLHWYLRTLPESCLYQGAIVPDPEKSSLPCGWYGRLKIPILNKILAVC